MHAVEVKNKLRRFLSSRLARNVYFWTILTFFKDSLTSSKLDSCLYLFLLIINISIFIIICTVNNLVLVPYLLRRKKYFLYVLLTLSIVFVSAFLYTLWLKYLTLRLPNTEIFEVSIVVPALTGTLTVDSILSEMKTIFYFMLELVFSFTGMWYINSYTRNEKLAQQAMKKQLETELNFLKNQINPHFLFNTLNNLYGLSLKHSEQTPEAILKLSSILRYVLYEANTESISFDKEKEIIQAYIDIEMLRLPENGNMQFSIMTDRSCSVPPLLWLPVLENVFKHGANTIEDNYLVDFRFALHENELTIYSRNTSKPKREKSNPERAGGIGLTNLRKRLEILYPGKHSFSAMADEANFYTVNVQIILNG